ncbi:Fe-S cluster assembly sulfur transfer protein SufU [Alloscardovia criceti]|uniref:Fe-S cluster assembly sulfur transfer protein SufU n=1 Tax=Alloscardovia criceti TaxID=356828 RepID=UPI000382629F|nr:SUF system NifU family Fe-S cluster assembly protein [Alloscardovia criceti]
MYDTMSDADLEQMYQEVILEAAKSPHGKAQFAADIRSEKSESESAVAGTTTLQSEHEYCVSAQSHQFNPTCGDEVTVRVELSDGSQGEPIRIEKLIWDGQGCSISQASLSIMYDLVHGKTLDEAMELSRTFKQLMESRGAGLQDEARMDRLEDAVVFQGVSKYPMRIKCALLGWEGLKDSAALALTQVSESTNS